MRRLCASLALVAAGCLEVPPVEPPMCKVTADCDAGEVCDEGVCWGNPPGMLAAVVSPPSARGDLVSRELPLLLISQDGWIDDIRFEAPVTFKGRLQPQCEAPFSCDGRPIRATVTVTRPPAFTGGPGFRDVTTVEGGEFEIDLPPSRPGDPPFTITVLPTDREAPGTGMSLARAIPPLQATMEIPASVSGHVFPIGGLNLPDVSGTVKTMTGVPLAGYRVVALGRWTPDQPVTEVSTVAFTNAEGEYTLKLSRNLAGFVEIVARPFNAQIAPELRLAGIAGGGDSSGNALTLPTATPGLPRTVTITVDHKETGGEVVPVAGARVIVRGRASIEEGISSMGFSAEGHTNEAGKVELQLLETGPLQMNYKLSIIPPPASKAAAMLGRPFGLADTSQRLATRIAITGAVMGADGKPVKDVSVTARPSLRFLWSLEPAGQAFLGEIPAPTAVTADTGEFVLFVDHSLPNPGAQATTVWGHYDLAFEAPATTTRVPSWTVGDVELPRDDTETVRALGAVQLPDAAFVRGLVFDDEDARVEGAEVRLYRVQSNPGLCDEVRFEPPGGCTLPPLLMGRATSDDDGQVRLTLPRLP